RMLKTLEEPPAFVHLVLITDRLADVLPTIRSRCQAVRFDAPTEEQLAQELTTTGIEPRTALAYARLGLGEPGRARELATGEGAALRERAQALVRGALAGTASGSGPWTGLLEAVKVRGERVKEELEERAAAEIALYPKREQRRVEGEWAERVRRSRRRVETGALDLALTLAETWLLDLAALAWGAEDLVRNCDRESELRADAAVGRATDVPALRRAVELVEDTRLRLPLNVSEDLACEALTHRLQNVLCQ
ncbi:MAG: hypothetical protein ACRDKL_03835, partial [Solirubrobacteraceae bacterium]